MAKKPAGKPKYWTKELVADLKELWLQNTPINTLRYRFADDEAKTKPKTPYAIQAQIVKLVVMELKNVHDTAAKEKILTTYRIPAHVAQHLDFYGDGHWEKDPLEQPNKTKVAEPDLIGEVDEFAEPVAKAPVKKEVSEPILPPPRKEPVKKEEPVAPFVQTVEVVNEVLEVQKALLVTDKESIAKLDRLEKKLDVMIELLQALLNK